MVSADVILRPRERSDFRAAASRSSNAAARALDSIYRTAAGSTRDEGDLALRFATVCVDQLGCRSGGKANLRPAFSRIARFERWTNQSRRHQLIEPGRRAACPRCRGDEFSNHAAMSRDRNPFTGFDPANVAAQVVLELPDSCGCHESNIATCSHIFQGPGG